MQLDPNSLHLMFDDRIDAIVDSRAWILGLAVGLACLIWYRAWVETGPLPQVADEPTELVPDDAPGIQTA